MYASQLQQTAPVAAILLMMAVGALGLLAGRLAISMACGRLRSLRARAQEASAGRFRDVSVARVSGIVMPACSVLFMCIAWVYGITVQGIALAALVFLLAALSVTDLAARIIPNAYLLAAIAVWALAFLLALLRACGALSGLPEGACALGIANGANAPAGALSGVRLGALFLGACDGNAPLAVLFDSLSGALGVSVPVYALSAQLDRINGKRNLGAGDVKLLFVTGLFLGLGANVLNLMLSCVLGGILGIARMRSRGAGDASGAGGTTFPFGPAIAISTALCIVFGPALLALCLS